MKYGKRRFLSFLLVLCMILTMFPVSSLAAEEDLTEDSNSSLSSMNGTVESTDETTEETSDIPAEDAEEELSDVPADAEDELISDSEDQTEEATDDAPDQGTVTENGEIQTYIPDADDLPDNDELFAGFVEREFYGENGIATLGVYGENVLTGLNAKIYTALKEKVAKVAGGELSSTKFTLTWEELGITQKSWTEEEIGVSIIVDGNFNSAAIAKVMEIIEYDSVSVSTIMDCLLADCPYELYWYNKKGEVSLEGFSVRTDGSSIYLNGDGLEFSFTVADDYAVSGENYTADTNKTGAASQAATNAQQYVKDNEGKSDYEKLIAYRDYICSAVSYNHDAAENEDTPYGDPWQLIYVFDGNPDTNVVCEGYSKAFQYLCDLSNFSDTICYNVTGTMKGGTGAGSHMWNIVKLRGNNYLVDVTNSDEGSVGEYGGLFLVGAPDGTAESYTITVPSYTLPDGSYTKEASITYTYDSNTTNLYDNSILTLATEDYDPVGVKLYGHSLSLSGNIGVNFYMELSQSVVDDENAYMQFTLPGVNHTEGEVLVQDAEIKKVDGKEYYVFPCGVAAKDMTGEIKAKIVLGDGRESEEYTYSVKEYADCIIENPEEYASDDNSKEYLVNLVKALLNYGSYAQQYFKTSLDNLANTGLDFALPEVSTVLSKLGQDYNSTETGKAEGLTYYGTSLMLTTKTGMRHYFTLEEGKDIADYTFTFNGKTLNPVQKGNYYYVEIQNISAQNLDGMYELEVMNNQDSSVYTIRYGVYTYVGKVLSNENDEIYLNLMQSLYQYGVSAKQYSGQ